jgi:transcriptional regulator with XRE-family HTH domain
LRTKPFADPPKTLGEHIKRCRLTRRLTQKQAAKLLGVSAYTVLNWEKNRTTHPTSSIPAILRFLGYDPFPAPRSLSERLLAVRRKMGWSIREAARQTGVDEGTWGAWESGAKGPRGRHLVLLNGLFRYVLNSDTVK